MNLLLTRPLEDSRRFARRLSACGVATEIAPLLAIRRTGWGEVAAGRFQAVLLTSANGARAFAEATEERACPVLAVGDATARAARGAGFADVASASGDVGALAALARASLKPEGGPLLHVAGSVVAGDLGRLLGEAGFTVERLAAYRAEAATALPAVAADGLRAGRFDGAVFFSPRTAATFARLSAGAGLASSTAGLEAFCLSQPVADALAAADWRARRVPPRPESEALARLICDSAERP